MKFDITLNSSNDVALLTDLCNEYRSEIRIYEKSNKEYFINAKNYIALIEWLDRANPTNLILEIRSNSTIECIDFEKQFKEFKQSLI